jgi:hypothetical protein
LFEAVCVRLCRHFLLRGLTVATAEVYRLGAGPQPYELFDLVLTQHCATLSPLVLPEYHYGGMGFGGHRDWDGKENAFFCAFTRPSRSSVLRPRRWGAGRSFPARFTSHVIATLSLTVYRIEPNWIVCGMTMPIHRR